MRLATLWKRKNGSVQCNLCYRRCVIPESSLGFCLVRKNVQGRLYTLNYGKLIAMHTDPIEKKPFYHFLPGTTSFSIACPGCNFACSFCQNWEISQVFRESKTPEGVIELRPHDVVKLALRNGCRSISYTYTEPTIFFEFSYDTAKLAKKRELKNTFVTNGYMTPEAIKKIAKYLDAAVVDFKASGNKECYLKLMAVPDPEPIFDSLLLMQKKGIHVEITTLMIPGYDKSLINLRNLVSWIADNLGSNTPFHILRFFPHYRLTHLEPTPIELLKKAYSIAKEKLNYVYVGNVPGFLENSYCHECDSLLIERNGYFVNTINVKNGKCGNCGATAPFVF